MPVLLVTGSSGLIGSDCVRYFDGKGWKVHGIDNNMRVDFFGPDGDTSWNLHRLKEETANFRHHNLDIRSRAAVAECVETLRPSFIIHSAAQPSHDLADQRPFDNFDVNTVGTMNILETARQFVPETPFCFMSTNKVYGEAPNELPLIELDTRWDYALPEHFDGVGESMPTDGAKHGIFGLSKLAADIMVREYGIHFGMKTVCFRGGCLTGPAHSAAELHGFLAYIVKCVREGRLYRIYGYKGKQVRDNLHSFDVCRAAEEFYGNPRSGEVYNLGGGRSNSASVLEAIEMAEEATGGKLDREYDERNRAGDHICYISDLSKFKRDYPQWEVTRSLTDIIEELCRAE